jgi:hypothetical protein
MNDVEAGRKVANNTITVSIFQLPVNSLCFFCTFACHLELSRRTRDTVVTSSFESRARRE